MKVHERVLDTGKFKQLCKEGRKKSEWLMKKVIVTQDCIYVYPPDKEVIISDYDMKIELHSTQAMSLSRTEVICKMEFEKKEEVSTLDPNFKFQVILVNKNEFEYSWLASENEQPCNECATAVNNAFIYLQVMSKLIDPFPQRLKINSRLIESKISDDDLKKIVICFIKSGKRLAYELVQILEKPFVLGGQPTSETLEIEIYENNPGCLDLTRNKRKKISIFHKLNIGKVPFKPEKLILTWNFNRIDIRFNGEIELEMTVLNEPDQTNQGLPFVANSDDINQNSNEFEAAFSILNFLVDNHHKIKYEPDYLCEYKVDAKTLFNSKWVEGLDLFVANTKLQKKFVIEGKQQDEHAALNASHLLLQFPRNQLRELCLYNTSMDDDVFKEFKDSIKHNAHIQRLELNGAHFTDRIFHEMKDAFESIPFLTYLVISHCTKIKGREHLKLFLQKINENLILETLDLSHNSMSESCFSILEDEIFLVENSDIKTFNFSYNNLTTKQSWNLFQLWKTHPRAETLRMIIEPYPLYNAYLGELFYDREQQDVVLLRTTTMGGHKDKHLKCKDMIKLDEIFEQIKDISLGKHDVEFIYDLCHTITHLNFEIPPQKLDRLCCCIRERLSVGILNSDLYCSSILEKSGGYLGQSGDRLDPELEKVHEIATAWEQECTKFFNLDFPEDFLNLVLDDLVKRAWQNDIRGTMVDTLQYVKELRDTKVNENQAAGLNPDELEQELRQLEPMFQLNYAGNFLTKDKIKPNQKLPCDIDLLVHPQDINYEMLCFYNEAYYLDTIDDLMNLKRKTAAHKLARDRCLHMLSNDYGKDYCRNKVDAKLRAARMLFQYRKHKLVKGKEMRVLYQHPVNEMLETLVDDISPLLIFEEFPGLKLAEEVKFEEKTYIENELKTGQEPDNYSRWITVEELERREGFLIFDDLIYHTSLRGCDKKNKEELNRNATIICEYFDKILGVHGFETDNLKELQMYIINLIKISKPAIDFDPSNPIGELCADEIYLEMYRMLNRNFTLDNVDEILACFKLLYIIVRYVIPTKDMTMYYLTWLEVVVMPGIYRLREGNHKYSTMVDWCIAIMIFIWGYYEKITVAKVGQPEMPPDGSIEEILGFEFNPLNIKVDLYLNNYKEPVLTLTIDIFTRTYQFMEFLKEQEVIIKTFDNVDFLWIYKCDNWSQSEDVAMKPFEILAHCVLESENQYFKDEKENMIFYVKNRIFPLYYPLPIFEEDVVLDTMWNQCAREFLLRNHYLAFLDLEVMNELACLVFAILNRRDPKIENIVIDTGSIIDRWEDYLPDYCEKYKTIASWSFMIKTQMDRNLDYYMKSDLSELKTQFISKVIDSFLFCSNTFKYKIIESTEFEIPEFGVISVNVKGVFFFPPKNFKRPLYRIKFEEFIRINKTVAFQDIDFLTGEEKHGNLKIKLPKTDELVEDIMAYLLVKVREDNKLYYASAFIFEDEYNKVMNPSCYNSPKPEFMDYCYQHLKEEYVNFDRYGNLPFYPNFFFKGMDKGLGEILLIVDDPGFWANRKANRINRDRNPEYYLQEDAIDNMFNEIEEQLQEDPEEVKKREVAQKLLEETILQKMNEAPPKSPAKPKSNPFKFSRKKTIKDVSQTNIAEDKKSQQNIPSKNSIQIKEEDDKLSIEANKQILANLDNIADKYDYSKKKKFDSQEDLLEILAILDKDTPEDDKEIKLEKWKDAKRKALVSRQKFTYDFIQDYTKNLTNYSIKKYMKKTREDELARWFHDAINTKDEYGDVKSVSALNIDGLSDISSPSPMMKKRNDPMQNAAANQKRINEIRNDKSNLKPGMTISDISAIEKRDMVNDDYITIDPNDKYQKRQDEIKMKRSYSSTANKEHPSPDKNMNYHSTITGSNKKAETTIDQQDAIKKRLEERQKKMSQMAKK